MGGAPQNLIGEGGGGGSLSQNMEGAWGQLKMLLKNTCEGVHLIVKLPAINLQTSKFWGAPHVPPRWETLLFHLPIILIISDIFYCLYYTWLLLHLIITLLVNTFYNKYVINICSGKLI